MPHARFLSSALVACIPVLLLVAPPPAAADVATTTVNEALRSPETPDPALERHVDRRERALTQMLTAAEVYAQTKHVRHSRLMALGYSGDLAALEHILPVPAFSYHLTAGFGASGPLWSSTHTGLDFAAPSGTSLVAVADGTITEVSVGSPYGLQTVLTLQDGTEVSYAHQEESLVMPGQTVEIGQPIGTVGSTGNSTGPHLHLEVRPAGGGPVDPNAWLADRALTP